MLFEFQDLHAWLHNCIIKPGVESNERWMTWLATLLCLRKLGFSMPRDSLLTATTCSLWHVIKYAQLLSNYKSYKPVCIHRATTCGLHTLNTGASSRDECPQTQYLIVYNSCAYVLLSSLACATSNVTHSSFNLLQSAVKRYIYKAVQQWQRTY